MNHKNKTDSKPGKTSGNMVVTFEFTRLLRICNPVLSKRGFVITFIPDPVEVSVFNTNPENWERDKFFKPEK
jgi:hypothetical protein